MVAPTGQHPFKTAGDATSHFGLVPGVVWNAGPYLNATKRYERELSSTVRARMRTSLVEEATPAPSPTEDRRKAQQQQERRASPQQQL
ncbi:hypothetical protein [Streptomyces sp. SID10815]|uniref:hypothetical protein n=1 Tax=Streptomyces sp. SID10815 TaxID=2706027 RepID=UPI0013CD9DCA|nr:hypothetical protein [Streptomyces sp. SID10815]NEA45217.1 hypothetical protein [Streptomyces sp. SID10815]NEA51950.1 hypothetical protein [Streptomyces sp. SID10815]